MHTIVIQSKIRTARWLPILAIIVSQVVIGLARAADDVPGQFPPYDYKFAKAAACGGAFEVNLGKIAAEKSTNASVQQFGRRMVKDHGQAGQNLLQIAGRNSATLPSAPTAAQQKEIDKLNQLSGADFDRTYVALMVKAHKADAKAFKKASEVLANAELKAFAAGTLPMVEDHLRMAQDLEQSLKRMASAGSL